MYMTTQPYEFSVMPMFYLYFHMFLFWAYLITFKYLGGPYLLFLLYLTKIAGFH